MAFNTATAKLHRYVVYMPDGSKTICGPFSLPEGKRVLDLTAAIRASPGFMKDEKLILLKCGDLPIETADVLNDHILEWLREYIKRSVMGPLSWLDQYFPTGPAPEEEKKIDVVVVTNSILEELRRQAVQKLLDKYDAKLRKYVAGLPWNKFLEAGPSANPEIASFINNLQIPAVSQARTVLLLHDLGNGIVDQSVVDELFNGESRFLVNASGSGKTRLLFEGLCKHWGFYFTPTATAVDDYLGSFDIMDAMRSWSGWSDEFTLDRPERLHGDRRDKAYRSNNSIVQRHAHQILTARILILERFLKIARETCPDRPINEFKKHWLFLQLASFHIFEADLFRDLSDFLKDASDEYLIFSDAGCDERLMTLQTKFCLDKDFFIIFDEAQRAIRELDGYFVSERDASAKRPVLTPIISAWSRASHFPIIVSGNNLSMHVVEDHAVLTGAKSSSFSLTTRTGSFDDRERHRDYLVRYLPRHIAESESGKEFVKRVWTFVRGRHRFTESIINYLLKTSFQSPHEVLNAWVKHFCGFYPFDSWRFVDNKCLHYYQINLIGIDFSDIRNNAKWLSLYNEILYKWLIQRQYFPLLDEHKTLAEIGKAQFVDAKGELALADEPVVLLGAIHHLRDFPGSSFKDYAVKRLADPASRGEGFEDFIMYCLACRFDVGTYLQYIFGFGSDVPEWSKQFAYLSSMAWEGETVKVNGFNILEFLSSTTGIGAKCETVEDTVEWFENPSSLMCFPDKSMGVDVVLFVRLESGVILTVVVQFKDAPPKEVQEDELSNVDPSNFYGHKSLEDEKYAAARERILKRIKLLNRDTTDSDIPTNGWFKDGLPLLRVVASSSTGVRQDLPSQCVSLDIAALVERIIRKKEVEWYHERRGIRNAGDALENFATKRAMDDDIAGPPRKKLC